jgi:CubicO group peptidase (beta-lactamase class C family)
MTPDVPSLRILPALLCAVLATACAEPAPMTFPDADWERAEPAAQGVDPEKLAAAVKWLDRRAGRGGASELVIARNGVLIWEGRHAGSVHETWSVTKVFTTTVLGLLVQDGRCDLDTLAAEHAPGLAEAHSDYARMRLRHLATMTSGYDAKGGSYGDGDGSRSPREPAPPLFEPGEKFGYWDDAMNKLGFVQTRIAGEPMAELFARRVAGPIGMRGWRWGVIGEIDGIAVNSGSGNLGQGVRISARELARLGHLFLNGGRWNGAQLLDPGFVAQATSPQVPARLEHSGRRREIDGRGVYGYAWWSNGTKPDGERKWPSAPQGTSCAQGDNNNRLCVIPEWGMVVVRLGTGRAPRDAIRVWDGFFARLGEALQAEPRRASLSGLLAAARARLRGLLADAAPEHAAHAAEPAGELRRWRALTLDFEGPESSEDSDSNPFRDLRLDVEFVQDDRRVLVPGYFAADGNAAQTGAARGRIWRAHFVPDAAGTWRWRASFRRGRDVALRDHPGAGEPTGFDGASGAFEVAPEAGHGGDPRGRGLLRYTGERYLRFAGSGEPFLKGGAGSPENLLAYADFDQTPPRHRYAPHLRHWREGDPSWRGGRGKGLVGALRYLAEQGMSSVYFLTMNVGGDGDDVWPWTARDVRDRFDVSKLAQWGLVFSHMDRLGLALHVITQETENDRLLDGGELGPERRLYYRELVARFGHHPALVWNLGEENRNSDAARRAFAAHLRALDPYDHPLALHTYPSQHDQVYGPLLGFPALEVASLQVGKPRAVHATTLEWLERSARAGRPWVVALDEIGPAEHGVVPDAEDPSHDRVRKLALWGHLMAGGAGVEWYFGYRHAHHDLDLEDFASRERIWAQTRVALSFFREHLPFAEMQPADALVDRGWCLAKPGEVYAVYLPDGGAASLELPPGRYTIEWYDPRAGGPLRAGQPPEVAGGGRVALGAPPAEPGADWAVRVQASGASAQRGEAERRPSRAP